MPGLHFHDLRHAGHHFSVQRGAGLRDLMARMGHDSEHAAMIYQHAACGADQLVTNAIDVHIQGEQGKDGDDQDGKLGFWSPRAHGTEDQQRLSGAGGRAPQTGSNLGLSSWSG